MKEKENENIKKWEGGRRGREGGRREYGKRFEAGGGFEKKEWLQNNGFEACKGWAGKNWITKIFFIRRVTILWLRRRNRQKLQRRSWEKNRRKVLEIGREARNRSLWIDSCFFLYSEAINLLRSWKSEKNWHRLQEVWVGTHVCC